jgi:DNA-binding NtrC family response regulator
MRHVLVAVFDPAIRTMLSEVLEVEGYQVTRARDQDQLIAVLRSTLHPLTVLLDVWAIEGGPSFSDEFLIALVTEHSRWERHAYIVTGGDAHFVAPYLSPSAKRFIADHAAATLPMPFPMEALFAAVETAIACP